MIRKLLLLSSLAILLASAAWGQVGVRKDDVVLTSRGSPAGGASVSICTSGLPTTGAQIIGGSLAVLTFASSPIGAGFVSSMGLTVSGFSGADSFLNGSYTIASVTSTTVTYALVHSNYTASSNGLAFQTGNASTPCAPLAQIFSDGNLTVPIAQPGLTADGIGNYGYWAAAGQYMAQFYGSTITTKVLPVTLSIPPGGTIANATNLVGPGNITGTFGGSPTLSVPLNSSVATGTGPLIVASTTQVTNLNAQLHGGLAAPGSAILGLTDSQAPTNKTINVGSNSIVQTTPSAGKYLRDNGTSFQPSSVAAAGAGGCSGVQFPQTLNDNATPSCVTPPTFVASGGSHAVGYVPDPGGSAGTTRFLREDATFAVPAGGATVATAYLTSSFTTTSATPANVTGLSFAVSANKNYTVSCNLDYSDSSSTAAPQIAWTGPASPTAVTFDAMSVTSSTQVSSTVATSFTSIGIAPATSTANFPLKITLTLLNGSNAGTIQLQAAVTNSGTLTILPGSCVMNN
jgi:hypothetical protein